MQAITETKINPHTFPTQLVLFFSQFITPIWNFIVLRAIDTQKMATNINDDWSFPQISSCKDATGALAPPAVKDIANFQKKKKSKHLC